MDVRRKTGEIVDLEEAERELIQSILAQINHHLGRIYQALEVGFVPLESFPTPKEFCEIMHRTIDYMLARALPLEQNLRMMEVLKIVRGDFIWALCVARITDKETEQSYPWQINAFLNNCKSGDRVIENEMLKRIMSFRELGWFSLLNEQMVDLQELFIAQLKG